MITWNVQVYATLDRPVPAEEAHRLATRIAGQHTAFARHHPDNRFGVAVRVDTIVDAVDAVQALAEAFTETLTAEGYQVVAWEAAEALSAAEVERRTAAAGMPELVSTAQVAELLGVTTKRVEQLEGERKRAAAEGQEHAFPVPVVPGWWVRAGVERYAANRRGPGRPKRDA